MFRRALPTVLGSAFFALLLVPRPALAHCDTMDGPVVKDARAALEGRDPRPVLKWVAPEREKEVTADFQHALAVRTLGPQARELADRFFFETLVRIHREGEGAPFTGLKPAGADLEPAVAASDRALETGSVDTLVKLLTAEAERGVRDRFRRTVEARRRMGDSVERGREYVAAYVQFVHYAERLHASAASASSAAHEASPVADHLHLP